MSHFDQDTLPEFPIPDDLIQVLDINDDSVMTEEALMYSRILDSLTTVKYVDLSKSHYLDLLKLALYLEEYQSNEEMKKRKLFQQRIQLVKLNKEEIAFEIHVNDLDEERPWIRENDFVDVINARTYKSFTLKVGYIMKDKIIAMDNRRFCNVFNPRHLYNIEFRFQNYPLRCSHYAIWIVNRENTIHTLFPDEPKSTNNQTNGLLTTFVSKIAINDQQKQAVMNILNKSSFPAPYILYGPPGTGKTATLVEAICQIHEMSSFDRILVCTPSNTAANEIMKRLLIFIPSNKVYRIFSQSKNRWNDKEFKHCSFSGKMLTPADIRHKAILVTTLCVATKYRHFIIIVLYKLLLMKLNCDYFSYIFIDEAGQGTEADIMIPFSIASKENRLHSQIVLAGDPQQLGPTVISKLADIILGRSILERLMSYKIYQKDSQNTYNPK
ncbi:putative helicase mov-10-B.1 [Phymastichus coffea]|uniref:putative helicase mov-10-B.1 n=1 Tax=Phymastichus coffea TaxID=108790 RepID=UPI00273BBA43|nr:putative helicase mov-10-B.1 [Phymastichus coffea]